MTYRSRRTPVIEDHSDTGPLEQNTPNSNMDRSRVSAQVRSNMAAMGIESPDLQSSQNSTMTYRELGTITTDVDNSTVSHSQVIGDIVTRSPIIKPHGTMSPATNDDASSPQSGRNNGFIQEESSRLTRQLVTSAMKAYMKKIIEKQTDALLDETQALIKEKVEDWLKNNINTSHAVESKNDSEPTDHEKNDHSDAGGQKCSSLDGDDHEYAVVSINTTPSDVVVVVSPGSDVHEMLNCNKRQVPSPSPIRAFQKHTRITGERSSTSRIQHHQGKYSSLDETGIQNCHINSASTKCSETKDFSKQVQSNQRHLAEPLNQKHTHMGSVLAKLRTSPLFSPVRRIKTMGELEKDLDDKAPVQAVLRINNGTSLQSSPTQNATNGVSDLNNNEMRPNKVAVTLFRDDEKPENLEPSEGSAKKTDRCGRRESGFAKAVKGLRMKGQWNQCFFRKEDRD